MNITLIYSRIEKKMERKTLKKFFYVWPRKSLQPCIAVVTGQFTKSSSRNMIERWRDVQTWIKVYFSIFIYGVNTLLTLVVYKLSMSLLLGIVLVQVKMSEVVTFWLLTPLVSSKSTEISPLFRLM